MGFLRNSGEKALNHRTGASLKVFVSISPLTAQAVAAAERHTVALSTDGTLWAWGLIDIGQLGIGTISTNDPRGINTPQQVGTNSNWGPPR